MRRVAILTTDNRQPAATGQGPGRRVGFDASRLAGGQQQRPLRTRVYWLALALLLQPQHGPRCINAL
jgi:hypothetical protein